MRRVLLRKEGKRQVKISAQGLAITKAHEGCKLKAYLDTGGVWTIGYGHTRGVKPGDTCTQAQADAWLLEDMAVAQFDVNDRVKVTLNQNQFDALASFVFNIGGDQFRTSTLLRKLNEGDYAGAAEQFPRWIHDNGKVINGLVARRADEKALFLAE
jgi:lysozyme